MPNQIPTPTYTKQLEFSHWAIVTYFDTSSIFEPTMLPLPIPTRYPYQFVWRNAMPNQPSHLLKA